MYVFNLDKYFIGDYDMTTYTQRNWSYDNLTDVLDGYPTNGITVKLSGGADSSIIYYALCNELADRNMDIPVFVATLVAEEKAWYAHYAKKVIDFTCERTGIKPVEHRTLFLPMPWDIDSYTVAQDELLNSIIDDNLANVYYGGLTANPDPDIMTKDSYSVHGMSFESYDHCRRIADERDWARDDNSEKYAIGYGSTPAGNRFLGVLPFIHLDKKFGTAAMYEKLGVTDDLLPITYSCEERDKNHKTFIKTVDGFDEYTHCGSCWFCMERAYAFGRLV